MASIYSTQIANATYLGATTVVLYTVPVGKLLVVTDIDLAMDAGAAGELSLVEIGAVPLLYTTSTAAGVTNQQWRGKQVLNAGGTIALVSQLLEIWVGITGYLLTIF